MSQFGELKLVWTESKEQRAVDLFDGQCHWEKSSWSLCLVTLLKIQGKNSNWFCSIHSKREASLLVTKLQAYLVVTLKFLGFKD